MADKPPNRFQKNNRPDLEDLLQSSESEESIRPVRTRQPTARYVDEVSPQQVGKYKAIKRKKVQKRTSQLVEMKREDEAVRRRLSEPDLSDSQTQSTKRVRTDLDKALRPTTSSYQPVDNSWDMMNTRQDERLDLTNSRQESNVFVVPTSRQ